MNTRRSHGLALPALALLAPALLAGCLTNGDVPIATATIQSVIPCVGCRSEEAVIVTLRGLDALPGATIVVHDLRMSLELGQRPAALVRADAHGAWSATLRALHVPGRLELPIFPGDVLEVFQKDGEGDASLPSRVTVPTPPRHENMTPIIDAPEPATPGPAPSTR